MQDASRPVVYTQRTTLDSRSHPSQPSMLECIAVTLPKVTRRSLGIELTFMARRVLCGHWEVNRGIQHASLSALCGRCVFAPGVPSSAKLPLWSPFLSME